MATRPYIKVDQSLADHPRCIRIDARYFYGALGLHVSGIGWCDRMRTDGFIPADIMPRLGKGSYKPLVTQLVSVGLWDEVEGGYQIHDYLDWQNSAEYMAERSESAKQSASHRWGNAKRNANRIANGNADKTRQDIQDKKSVAREDIPDSKIMTSTPHPPCLNADIEVIDPAYTGSCWGFIVGQAEAQFGTLLSPAERTELADAIAQGCIHGCTGEHPVECAVHIYDKLKLKGKTRFATSRLWLKCIREDRMEVRQ